MPCLAYRPHRWIPPQAAASGVRTSQAGAYSAAQLARLGIAAQPWQCRWRDLQTHTHFNDANCPSLPGLQSVFLCRLLCQAVASNQPHPTDKGARATRTHPPMDRQTPFPAYLHQILHHQAATARPIHSGLTQQSGQSAARRRAHHIALVRKTVGDGLPGINQAAQQPWGLCC